MKSQSTTEGAERIAAELRNTPAVCRKSYINPVVFEAWRAGRLPQPTGNELSPAQAEKVALVFLKREARRTIRPARLALNRPERRASRPSASPE